MASTSAYASTPRIGSANLTAALAGTRQTPTGATTLLTAGSVGTVVTRAVIINSGTGDPSDNVVAFYLHDGTNFFLYYEVDLDEGSAQPTPSTSQGARIFDVPFNDLVLPPSWSLRAGIRVRGSSIDDTTINVFGGDI